MELSKEQLARVWLQCAPMGAWARLEGLKEKHGGALGVWENFTPQYYELLGPENFSYLADLRASRCGAVLRELDTLNAFPLFLGEEDYPASLASIPDPPDVLFIRGTLPKDFSCSIAMVGSRRATRYGAAQARRIAKGLAEKNVIVVSGLARGIDAASHQGALDGSGPTVAVLGSGLGRMYPPENKELAQRILDEGGAIVSELAPDAQPLPYHFPARNRIISGLSSAVLLIEAQLKSGTHSTIEYAQAQRKEVFALPGNVDAPGSELPLMLLKDGANLCTGPDDILVQMGWQGQDAEQSSFLTEEPGLDESDPNYPILKALALEEKTLEELIAETGRTAGELGAQLTILEISGKIECRAGRAFALVR